MPQKKLTHETGRVQIACGTRKPVHIGTNPKTQSVNVKGEPSEGISVELFNNTDHDGVADPWVQCDRGEGEKCKSGYVEFKSDGWESVRVEIECV